MSKTGRYIGGHTVIGPDSGWFTKGSTAKKKSKAKTPKPKVIVSVVPSPVKLVTKEEMERTRKEQADTKAVRDANRAKQAADARARVAEKKRAAHEEKRAAKSYKKTQAKRLDTAKQNSGRLMKEVSVETKSSGRATIKK